MSEIKAIFFDQDGVIIDTERDGHRVAFNKTFNFFNLNFEWDVDDYHDLLQIAGGKERIKYYLHSHNIRFNNDLAEEEAFINKIHNYKTETFIKNLIESGQLPLRPGIHRFMQEAEKLTVLGFCTTSHERTARAITQQILRDIHFEFVLAGDIVSKEETRS